MNENKKTNNKPDTPASQQQRTSPLLIGLTLVSFIIAIIALIFAFLSLKKSPEQSIQLGAIKEANQIALNNLEQKEASLQNEVSAKLAKNEAALNQLLQQTTNIPAEAALAEATYLTHLAELNAKFSGDRKTAKEMLHLALQRIENFHTLKIEALKNQINMDLQALNENSSFSTNALLTSLDNLIISIKEIPVLPSTEIKTNVETATTAQEKSRWDHVKQNLAKIKSFVVIQKIENPNDYAFDPEKKILTKQLILIKLTQAQWAVINRDQPLYQQCLQSVLKMIPNLNVEKSVGDSLVQQINNLLAVSFYPPSSNNLKNTQNMKGDK